MKGFTLIEVIIFILLAAIIIPAVFISTSPFVKEALTPTNIVKARFLAEMKMEDAMAYTIMDSYTYTLGQASYTDVVNQSDTSDPDRTQFAGFQYKLEYSDIACQGPSSCTGYQVNPPVLVDTPGVNTGYKKITVSIRLPDGLQEYKVYGVITQR
jgi:Tfp pilus assembly protein PilE